MIHHVLGCLLWDWVQNMAVLAWALFQHKDHLSQYGDFHYHIKAETKWKPLRRRHWFPIKISLKFVPKGLIKNIPALVQIMAWRRPGDKPLFEPMMVRLPTHICVARPQWVIKVRWSWDYLVSYTQPCETNAGCPRQCDPTLRQLFGDVTKGQWCHN